MLHTQSVNPRLLELLKELMTQEILDDFLLVGGTGLALQIGHRISIDIDLFGEKELDEIGVSAILNSLGNVRQLKKSNYILVYTVDGVKVDFVNYSYPWIKPPVLIEGIRIASREDIGAMKLNAIAGRGSRKDFIDLYFLLQEFTLKEIISFFEKKYAEGSTFLVLKSLTYFEDADQDEMPLMIEGVEWQEVKSTVLETVKNYLSTA